MSDLRPPPYASRLRPGLRELRVYAGSGAWDRARAAEASIVVGVCASCGAEQLAASGSRGAFVVLPPDETPDSYRWPVAGLAVLVVVIGEWSHDACRQLGVALLDAGARRVVAVWPTGDLTVYEP